MKNLFKRWLSGEANWAEEKKLRQTASEDAFLAEAMEGYDAFPEGNHSARIEKLKNQIGQKTKQRRPLVFYINRVAAAAALIGAFGLFFWLQSDVENEQAISHNMEKQAPNSLIDVKKDEKMIEPSAAVAEMTPEKSIDKAQKIEDKRQTYTAKKENPNPKIQKPKPSTPISPPPSSSIFTNEPVQKQAPVESALVLESPAEEEEMEEINDSEISFEDEEIGAIMSGGGATAPEPVMEESRVMESDGKARTSKKRMKTRSQSAFLQTKPAVKTYRGQVKNQYGESIENVKIADYNSKFSTFSTQNGNFLLQVDTSIQFLALTKVGHHPSQVSITEHTTFLDVKLIKKERPGKDISPIAQREKSSITPRPKGGFLKFERYLKKHLIYPEEANEKGIEQEVEVRFYINEAGRPVDLETIGNDVYGFEKEAIRLIQNGPKWKPMKNKASYIVKFKLDK